MSNKKKTASEYIESEYGTAHLASVMEMKDTVSIIGLMQDFSDYNVKACLPDAEQIHYKGKGEHSVNELESIASAYAELWHQINVNR